LLDPRPTKHAISRAYTEYYTHGPPGAAPRPSTVRRAIGRLRNGFVHARYGYDTSPRLPAGQMLDRLPLFPERVDYWLRHLHARSGAPTLLDVGCGNGQFLVRMAMYGWTAEGIDTDPAAVAAAQRAGLRVRKADLDSLRVEVGPKAYDAVTLGHVIEHLHDPVAALRTVHELLREGGVVWIATPNVRAFNHRRYGREWLQLDPPRHVVIFSSSSLIGALAAAGFDQPRELRPPPDVRRVARLSSAIARGDDIAQSPRRLGPVGEARGLLAELLTPLRPSLAEEVIVFATKS
jgi:SAM-dependent methyltransferase